MTAEKSVLVVDDSSTIRNILQKELTQAGYEVFLADNGMEALIFLEWTESLPDIITLDIDMPKMDGFEVCEKLKQRASEGDEKKQRAAEIPILFVSANDTVENRERGYQLGSIDFISKPFSAGDIVQAINRILLPQESFPDMTALVVDDSVFVRKIISRSLSRYGLQITESSGGHEALDFIRKSGKAIDIIITDHMMPNMSGEELCRQLKLMKKLAQVPIFFISSMEDKKTTLKFFRAGASDYLPKPFLEEEFRARVLTHLRNRKYVRELELLTDKLRFQAEHDGLTGMYNRGYFQKTLYSVFDGCKQSKVPLSCIILDLDFFKKVNDNYGHAFGDLVLKQFASILQQGNPPSGIAARYGGEEFVMLLPDVPTAAAEKIAEDLRKTNESHTYSDGNQQLQVTISLGIASLDEHHPENPDKLLSFADAALYRAKEQGRNRVEIYSETAN